MDGQDRAASPGPTSVRPRITVERTGTDTALDGLALAGWLSGIAAVVFSWHDLPDRLPMHFDLAGEPNRWGPRWELFVPVGISFVLHVGTAILTKFPHVYNYLVEITPENASRQYALAVRLVRSVNVVVQWLFAAVTWTILKAAQGQAHPGIWLIPTLVAGTFVILIIYLIQASSDQTSRRPS